MNILFCAIFDYTRLYYEIATSLKDRGHSVYWTTTDEHWTSWLLARGVDRSHITELVYRPSDFLKGPDRDDTAAALRACEDKSDLTVNQSILMDKFLMHILPSDINDFVLLYFRDLKRLFEHRSIDMVFAEPTNLGDLLTLMVAKWKGARYLCPWDMRYPLRRVIFTEGHLLERIVSKGAGESPVSGDSLLKEFAERQTKPFYYDKNQKARLLTLAKVRTAARNRLSRGQVLPGSSLTHHRITERLGLLWRRWNNSRFLRNYTGYAKLEKLPGRIAYYGLHVQPEASIDVRGSYFSDQLKLVKDIRRALPFDMTLVVKEHPNFLGIRGKKFIEALKKIPNVALVHHDVSTRELFDGASLVLTVSGTAAYEAGMLGIPAVTFSPMYFSGLSSVHTCHEITRLRDQIREILSRPKRDYENDCRVMEEMVSRSWDGYWVDPENDPAVMEPDNLQKLRKIFLEVVSDDSH